MPSADTAQSALCAAYISLIYPAWYASIGGLTFHIGLIAAVANGRVFYHCHYIGDCLIGACVGTAVAYGFYYGNLSSHLTMNTANLIIPKI